MPDLSIIIVSWNVCDLLRQCILSILTRDVRFHGAVDSDAAIDIEIIVVDNGSADGTVRMLREEFPGICTIENASNPGFATANNQGIARAHGRYLLLLNPDTEVVGQTLAAMIEFAEVSPDIGLLGPQLLNTDGSVQSSRRRFPTITTALFESTWLEPLAPRALSIATIYVIGMTTRPWTWIGCRGLRCSHGVKWSNRSGGWDERYFMYSEELDWCRCIKNAGWRIVYFPKAQVVHHGGKSSDQVTASRHIYFQTSKVLYFRKYHGVCVSEILRIFFWETTSGSWAWSA